MNTDEQIAILTNLVNDFIITAGAVVEAGRPTQAQLNRLRQTLADATTVMNESPFHISDESDDPDLA
ncbi:hypothetical protein [Mesorhizobium sp. IMUNJ 23232]|uniref:hypothetical protein n=1 Tax=Mesorhizobium sp. IMUNJ 23232 TaxID=3376064 RepID=UPI00378EC6C7